MKWSELDYALTLLFGNLFRRASISSICPAEKTTLPSPYPLFVERLLSADSEGSQALRSILFLYCLKRVGPLMYKRAIFCLVPVPGWPHSHQPSPVPQSDVIVRHRDHLINMEDTRDGSCFPKMGQWCVQDASQPALTLLLTRLKAAATKIQTTCNSPLCKSKKIHWENEDK